MLLRPASAAAAREDAEAEPNFTEPVSDLAFARFVEGLIRHAVP